MNKAMFASDRLQGANVQLSFPLAFQCDCSTQTREFSTKGDGLNLSCNKFLRFDLSAPVSVPFTDVLL